LLFIPPQCVKHKAHDIFLVFFFSYCRYL